MFSLPQLKQLTTQEQLENYAQIYLKASGLPVPMEYLEQVNNHVFGILLHGKLIGGFILGNGPDFRTIQLFANEVKHEEIYEQLEAPNLYTEICCFWIARPFRRKTRINFFIWLSMAYALKRYGANYFLFGTCSRSLARLYATTEKSIQLHRDRIHQKATFIFWAERKTCVQGILEIVGFKLKRVLQLSGEKRRIPSL